MRLRAIGDFLGLWAYLIAVGGGLPQRKLMTAAYRSASRASRPSSQPGEGRRLPVGWAVLEGRPQPTTIPQAQEDDGLAAAS